MTQSFFTAHLYIKQFSFNNRVILVADLAVFYRLGWCFFNLIIFALNFFIFKGTVFVPGFLCEDHSGCRLHTSAPELRLNPMSSDELQISYQHNFKFLISLFRGFSAPLSPVLTLQTQKNTKIKNIGI